ncbi:FYVE, RhoGEF and PH domain-containing protein 6 [Bombina bombina]|uniref:FYVE, RhoGEF and PH domain-containing protein 6 n=1 Tax=Bombina bombina TaxID=8345 RepID=UPI00235A9C83|nr:FYVE, RhoGEF and PH domain-containing protein 6 [Bombina bombina]
MSAADVKKPPVAPKPKHVLAQKPSPPPVAPKPDLVLSSASQSSRKSKPTIAPKPKVLKGSSVSEDRPQSAIKSVNISKELHKGNSSENVRWKKDTIESSTYIIPSGSCNCDCGNKIGNGECLQKNHIVIERLENLENRKNWGQPLSCTRPNKKPCSQQVKGGKAQQTILKANSPVDKDKDVLNKSVFTNGHAYKYENSERDFRKVTHTSVNCKTGHKTSETSFSICEELTHNVENHNKSEVEESRSLLLKSSSELHSDSEIMGREKHLNGNSVTGKWSTREDGNILCPPQRAPPPLKVLPVPKPRKLRTPCLVRQDCIESPTEGNENPASLVAYSQNFSEHELNGIDNCNKQVEPSDKCNAILNQIVAIRTVDEVSIVEKEDISVNSDTVRSTADNQEENNPSTPDFMEKSCFVRFSSLSMSLPKQLKLICEQNSHSNKSLRTTTETKNTNITKNVNSPRVPPKKPQRHSLPAAGLLKKSASEEQIDKLHDFNNSSASRGVAGAEENRHPFANEQSLSSLFNTPKQPPEKPVWKLPHPILPLVGNQESLKSSLNNEAVSPITKPRAKSLSSVDMDRIDKPFKESPKKSSLRTFLTMKLSVCIIKSDFQKFLSRGCKSSESASSDISCSGSSPMPVPCRNKPAKARSADSYSPSTPKRKLKHKSEFSIASKPTTSSLDEELFLSQKELLPSAVDFTDLDPPEYENICHYEEIPEYENLPYTLVSDKNDESAIYEVEDPDESFSNFAVSRHEYHCETSQDEADDVLGIVHSDDEEIINSSDEDEFSSDSSKADLDHLDYKKNKGSGQKTKLYHIAKEIMSSEKAFVDALKLLHIDFRYAVAQTSKQLGKPVVEDKVLNQILYYLPQLYELNCDVLRELEERMSPWNENQKIADIFVKKGPYLKMYSTYIREFDRNVALLDEQCKKNPSFAGVVKDFEMSPRCANLALKHYLLKPVQRIPQYRLLLTDYLKNLTDGSSDYSDTQAALSVVIEVANHANDIMKQGDNFQKLMQIQYSLNGHHEIVQPGRVFLKEGTLMKLSRKVMQPRMFFLFNDTLLYTTPVQSGMYKLNNMLSLAGMKVNKPTQEAYQNELNIESVERSFILSASSATERDDWLEAISRAIEDYSKKKITFNPARSLEEVDTDNEKGDSPLGTKAPIWIPDVRVTMCMICTSEFTLTWRRHHCRACGKIICQACSTNKHSLEYLKNHLARVCDHCFQELQKQDNHYTPKTGSPANHKSPSSALSSVLHSIPSGRKQKKIPAALKVSASTEDSSMSGYLQRAKGNKKQWKQLWFVIKNKVLYTYAASEDIAALESQPLLGFTVKEVNDDSVESNVIHLLHKNTLFYIFKADDAHTTQRWIEAFQEATIL